MTNDLEHKTKIRLDNIEDLMKDVSPIPHHALGLSVQALYKRNSALYLQNQIIIDYQQEIYKMLKGKQK